MSVRTICLDAMGGDHGPSVCVEGAIDAIMEAKEPVRVILVGDKKQIDPALHQFRHKLQQKTDVIEVVDVPDFVRMNSRPNRYAVRKRPSASACA